MSLHTALVFAFALSLFVVSPGPGVLGVVGTSMKSGLKSAAFFIIGMICGDMVYLMFAIFGLAAMAAVMGKFFYIVRVLGGLYLIYIGAKMLMSKDKETKEDKKVGKRGSVLAGFLITISNPKVIIMYCGFLPNFIDLSTLKATDIFMVGVIVAIVITCVMGTYAILAAKTGSMLSRRSSKILNRSAGCVIIGAGSFLIFKRA